MPRRILVAAYTCSQFQRCLTRLFTSRPRVCCDQHPRDYDEIAVVRVRTLVSAHLLHVRFIVVLDAHAANHRNAVATDQEGRPGVAVHNAMFYLFHRS